MTPNTVCFEGTIIWAKERTRAEKNVGKKHIEINQRKSVSRMSMNNFDLLFDKGSLSFSFVDCIFFFGFASLAG